MRQPIRGLTAKITSIENFKTGCDFRKGFEGKRAETILQIADFVADLAETQPDLGLKFAGDATTPPSVLAALGRSQNRAIRARVARNSSTDDLTAYFLKHDQCADVRQVLRQVRG